MIERVLMEVVGWMVSAGLLVHKPDSSGSLWCFITRRGWKIQADSDFNDFREAPLLSRTRSIQESLRKHGRRSFEANMIQRYSGLLRR